MLVCEGCPVVKLEMLAMFAFVVSLGSSWTMPMCNTSATIELSVRKAVSKASTAIISVFYNSPCSRGD